MIKRLGIVALVMLALNFLAVLGGVGYLVATGKLDDARARAIAQILFPEPTPTSQPATQPTTSPADGGDPMFQIDALLDKQAGKTAAEQVAVVRAAYEALATQLDRQRREIVDMKRQIDLAQSQVMDDRAAVERRESALSARLAQQKKLDADEGFKKSLAIYDEMSPQQLKQLFMKMDDATVVRYLQAMEPRRVSRIVKEYASPDEVTRAQTLLDRMRSNNAIDDGAPAAGPRGTR